MVPFKQLIAPTLAGSKAEESAHLVSIAVFGPQILPFASPLFGWDIGKEIAAGEKEFILYLVVAAFMFKFYL